ncbi:uncharacterized protein LAESUDRAFT_739765 [Laetiporus sulphureus 93-53]|uniref:RING-type domain-containing protein n=1 Tax=Laetiporus sulphureus 93-53 TaxID=1314785 RepID=A0A165B1L2_9APHY|nr:uncharacterized protein LAESUDRAFT_739765 [Laetiporus sulphureus 93-53]KZT00061.1 hypothetical protein LAESUDRAFT_739765 [Laetiporus sulphureus 93-53]
MPGPLGFITSGYFFGLFVMALVLNRIHNIVVPPRNPLAVRLHAVHHYRGHGRGRGRWPFNRAVLGLFFPVDLSSTSSRTLFRIPSIYLLLKSLFVWFVLLLQASQLYPSWQWGPVQAVGKWVAQKEMEDICWHTFTSTCIALAIGALTSGLEGLHLNHNAPFNLFSFAFQLHIYASSSTHTDKVQGAPSRPNKHVIITMLIPLLQLTLLHCLEVKKRWGRLRLIPTSICSLLNLVHFHSVVWTSPSSYPLTNFFPCVVESMLCVTVIFSASLNVLTQLILEGAITRPLFGHAETLMPKLDEDFGVALIRLGTASLEATSAAGMGNEVGGVTSADGTGLVRFTSDDRGVVEIDRSGVVSLIPAYDRQGQQRIRKRGFANEITHVKAQAQRADLWADTMVNASWFKAFAMFLITAFKTTRRLTNRLYAYVRTKLNPGAVAYVERPAAPREPIYAVPDHIDDDELEDAELYRRFLRGEPLSDDDEEYEDPMQADNVPSTPSEDEDDGEDEETVRLYADLSQDVATSTSAPLLLAHMTSASTLTRRRYNRLVSERGTAEDVEDEWQAFVREQRGVKSSVREDGAAEARQNCVVCTAEPRDIICWPCRCLALCNDCRENLASRSSASKHSCPCCRRSVEGYSRIYIP